MNEGIVTFGDGNRLAYVELYPCPKDELPTRGLENGVTYYCRTSDEGRVMVWVESDAAWAYADDHPLRVTPADIRRIVRDEIAGAMAAALINTGGVRDMDYRAHMDLLEQVADSTQERGAS